MSKAVIQIKQVRRPISQETIGFRIEAAVPNMNGRKMRAKEVNGDLSFYATKEEVPSFRRPYLIEQSSDHHMIDKPTLERFLKSLSYSGFTEFEFVGKYQGAPLADLMN